MQLTSDGGVILDSDSEWEAAVQSRHLLCAYAQQNLDDHQIVDPHFASCKQCARVLENNGKANRGDTA